MKNIVVAAGLFAALIAAPLSGQAFSLAQPLSREAFGPYVEVGAILGRQSTTCDGCVAQQQGAWGLRSGLGWQFGSRVRTGLEIDGMFKDESWARQSLIHVVWTTQVRITGRYHVRAGLGDAFIREGFLNAGKKVVIRGHSAGWLVGAGVDLPLNGDVVLAPTLTYRGAAATDLTRAGKVVAFRSSFNVVELGVGFRWHLRSLIWPTPKDKSPS